jgi:hypothetical protein
LPVVLQDVVVLAAEEAAADYYIHIVMRVLLE